MYVEDPKRRANKITWMESKGVIQVKLSTTERKTERVIWVRVLVYNIDARTNAPSVLSLSKEAWNFARIAHQKLVVVTRHEALPSIGPVRKQSLRVT